MTFRRALVATIFLFLSPPLASPCPAADAQRVVLVLDASGSMWGQIDGRAKIEIAREAVGRLLAQWDPAVEIGLVAYGHRREGDCGDIELVVPPGAGGASAVAREVAELQPKGKTPLGDAVRQAAESLRYQDVRATVILVSDGIETCGVDPCALGTELAMQGVDFRAHVIGFDIAEAERGELECLATNTGGRFLPAEDADQLRASFEEVAAELEAAPEPIVDEPGEATLVVPPSVEAGADFEVSWTGPGSRGDFLMVAAADAPPHASGNYQYVRRGNPSTLVAPSRPGTYEVRYVYKLGPRVLAKEPIEVVDVTATVSAPATAPAGSDIQVAWTGPAYRSDYVTIVPPDTPDDQHDNYTYVRKGNPLDLRTPDATGTFEVRYVMRQDRRVLARTTMELTAVEATVTAADTAPIGSALEISWTGPDHPSDYITIVPADTPEGKHDNYTYTRKGNPVEVRVPAEPGDYEIRYVMHQSRRTLARRPLTVTSVDAQIRAPASMPAGSDIEVTWDGPDASGDYLTIVPVGTPEGKHENYVYTRRGNPASLRAPDEPGDYEIRYVLREGRKTLGSVPITIDPVTASLEAPATAEAGGKILVTFTGPMNRGDYIAIGPKDEPRRHVRHAYVRRGNPLEVDVPREPGEYELRYQMGQSKKILASRPLKVE